MIHDSPTLLVATMPYSAPDFQPTRKSHSTKPTIIIASTMKETYVTMKTDVMRIKISSITVLRP